jgi:hypothetical protein
VYVYVYVYTYIFYLSFVNIFENATQDLYIVKLPPAYASVSWVTDQSCYILDSAKPFYILLENQRSCFLLLYLCMYMTPPFTHYTGALVLVSFSSFHSLVFFPSFPLFRQSFPLLPCSSFVYIYVSGMLYVTTRYISKIVKKSDHSLLTYVGV